MLGTGLLKRFSLCSFSALPAWQFSMESEDESQIYSKLSSGKNVSVVEKAESMCFGMIVLLFQYKQTTCD